MGTNVRVKNVMEANIGIVCVRSNVDLYVEGYICLIWSASVFVKLLKLWPPNAQSLPTFSIFCPLSSAAVFQTNQPQIRMLTSKVNQIDLTT